MYTEATKRAKIKYKKAKRKVITCELDKQYYEQFFFPYMQEKGMSVSMFVKKCMEYVINNDIDLSKEI